MNREVREPGACCRNGSLQHRQRQRTGPLPHRQQHWTDLCGQASRPRGHALLHARREYCSLSGLSHTLPSVNGVGSLFFVLFLMLFYPDIHILSLTFQCAFSYVSICSILRFNMLSLTFQYALSYVSICFFLSLNMLYFTFQYAFSYV